MISTHGASTQTFYSCISSKKYTKKETIDDTGCIILGVDDVEDYDVNADYEYEAPTEEEVAAADKGFYFFLNETESWRNQL